MSGKISFCLIHVLFAIHYSTNTASNTNGLLYKKGAFNKCSNSNICFVKILEILWTTV